VGDVEGLGDEVKKDMERFVDKKMEELEAYDEECRVRLSALLMLNV
jgi:hypothetical protein